MDENARKRKRKLEGEDSSDLDMDIEKEKPLEGMKQSSKSKKQRTDNDGKIEGNTDTVADKESDVQDAKAKARADKRKQKLEKKKEKLEKRQQKQDAKKSMQKEFGATHRNFQGQEDDEDDIALEEDEDDHIQDLDVSGLVEGHQSTVTPSSANSNASTASVASAASSSSSIIPPTTEEESRKKKREEKEHKSFSINPEKHEAFRARLTAKLEAMRAARKADGPDGKPAKNRAELIEARRKKQAERKAAKKASRQLAKEEEDRLKAEEQLARIRGGSGSPSIFSRSTPDSEHNFSFGRIAWKDGQQLESNLSGFLKSGKKKGKSDPKTALEAAEYKRARVSGFDEAKRKDIEEKDLWLAAKKRAQGEKVHDDAALLRKRLKRQEKAKAKSKQEWKDRLTSVQKGKEAKQKKREENLKKRREEKGNKGKGKGKKVNKPGKKVRRPGFEGTFKAR